MSLENEFEVRLGQDTMQMTLPVTVEVGQRLETVIDYLAVVEPPEIVQPIVCPAVLQHHWWQAKTKPVRVGPSEEHWDLHIEWRKDRPLMNFILHDNIVDIEETSAIFEWCKDHDWLKKGKEVEYIPPGQTGNPTINTPAYVQIIDSGTVRIYESSDVFVKLDIRFERLKGHFVFVRRDPRLNLWTLSKESPKAEVR